MRFSETISTVRDIPVGGLSFGSFFSTPRSLFIERRDPKSSFLFFIGALPRSYDADGIKKHFEETTPGTHVSIITLTDAANPPNSGGLS
jgi:hypothetical protein